MRAVNAVFSFYVSIPKILVEPSSMTDPVSQMISSSIFQLLPKRVLLFGSEIKFSGVTDLILG